MFRVDNPMAKLVILIGKKILMDKYQIYWR